MWRKLSSDFCRCIIYALFGFVSPPEMTIRQISDVQIGQSGTTFKPDMIINVAISGSVQYQVGMQNSKCVVSINHNAASPIFDISHYGAVADFKAVLPTVIAEIKNRRA